MTPPDRPARADSVQNREALLFAAEYEFSTRGLDVSVADIAARAGLGKGTLFRHFPTKDDLIGAIVEIHVAELDAAGRRFLDAPHPGEALLDFLTLCAERRRESEMEFLLRVSGSDPKWAALSERFLGTLTALVTRAQRAGHVRDDVTGLDVMLMMCAPAHIAAALPDASPDLWRRYLALIFDGLRPTAAHSLPAFAVG